MDNFPKIGFIVTNSRLTEGMMFKGVGRQSIPQRR
jgi:hypothetical protein